MRLKRQVKPRLVNIWKGTNFHPMQPNQTSQAPYNYLDWVLESRDRGKQKKNENHSSQSLDCSSKMPTRSKGPHIWKIFGKRDPC